MAKKTPQKHVGDVIGVSRSRAKKPIPSDPTSSRRRATGIELPPASASARKTTRARVVGGVRGRDQ